MIRLFAAYVVVALLERTNSDVCYNYWALPAGVHSRILAECNTLIAVILLSLLEILLLVGWFTWLAVLAHRVRGYTPKQAYKIPAHRLVAGVYPDPDVKYFMGGEEGEWTMKRMSGHSSVDANDKYPQQYPESPAQMVNPYYGEGHEDARMSSGAAQLLSGEQPPEYYVPPPASVRQEAKSKTGAASKGKQGGYSYSDVGL